MYTCIKMANESFANTICTHCVSRAECVREALKTHIQMAATSNSCVNSLNGNALNIRTFVLAKWKRFFIVYVHLFAIQKCTSIALIFTLHFSQLVIVTALCSCTRFSCKFLHIFVFVFLLSFPIRVFVTFLFQFSLLPRTGKPFFFTLLPISHKCHSNSQIANMQYVTSEIQKKTHWEILRKPAMSQAF